MNVISLHTYPIKAMRGLSHDAMSIEQSGASGDRRFMVVDGENHFLSQREISDLATIAVLPSETGLLLSIAGEEIAVDTPNGSERVNAMMWGEVVHAALVDNSINQALSAALGRKVKLVYMDDAARRSADPEFAGDGKEVSFADGFPYLVTNENSLTALNDHIMASAGAAGAEPVGMERFRTNIAVTGAPAFDEDTWKVIRIGDVLFDCVKPCARCAVTTRDQLTGATNPENQPVRALTQIRRSADRRVPGVLFGENLVPRNEGTIYVGDEFEVLERRAAWPVSSFKVR
ncbi:MAG: MOSC domain-containing protein [Pseudomonadota bacterium]